MQFFTQFQTLFYFNPGVPPPPPNCSWVKFISPFDSQMLLLFSWVKFISPFDSQMLLLFSWVKFISPFDSQMLLLFSWVEFISPFDSQMLLLFSKKILNKTMAIFEFFILVKTG